MTVAQLIEKWENRRKLCLAANDGVGALMWACAIRDLRRRRKGRNEDTQASPASMPNMHPLPQGMVLQHSR